MRPAIHRARSRRAVSAVARRSASARSSAAQATERLRARADAEGREAVGPELLVRADGHGDGRDAGAQARRRGPRGRVVDHRRTLRHQPVVGDLVDGQDVVVRHRQPGQPCLDDAADPGPPERVPGDPAEPLPVAGRHAAEADEHRRRPGGEEVDEIGGRLPRPAGAAGTSTRSRRGRRASRPGGGRPWGCSRTPPASGPPPDAGVAPPAGTAAGPARPAAGGRPARRPCR